ncbi:UDP-glucose:protein N-beta-glucosyltransferase [Actinobacillus vicugnae]|uniref:UDP-glucose:protein N-beta-glucosyltransferase n=1 Tax=Actinobacillus vicugnae TaxID=2573093 RepID=UPI00123FC8E7|nr:adhesin [Actinobacillus vicugnae]
MEHNKKPNLTTFEAAVAAKKYEEACSALLEILAKLDSNFGGIQDIEFEFPTQLKDLEQEKTVYFCTRLATAISTLFSDPGLEISVEGAQRFLVFQRWLSLIFASSPFINADHILQTYNRNPNRENSLDIHLDATKAALIKFCILYLPESNVNLNLDAAWNADPELCASLCFALQSPRFIGTPAAFSKRGAILQWFPARLAQLQNLNNVPSAISHDVYMHCSYDIAANKHDVKKALNQVIRRHIENEYAWQDRDVTKVGYRNGKPVMVVLLEHFHSAHSIYRTHSTSMIAAREHFHLIGLGNASVDQAGRDVFDEFHLVDGNSMKDKLEFICSICETNGALVFYMPSIGMDLATIFASNTRLAPVQVIALGHPATTHSDFIEYVIVEDDYVGSEECFSETLLRLPKDALPYVPSALAPEKVDYLLRENPEVVNIGIASTTMKLNPYFLEALKAIRDRAKVKVHFHFALGQSNGVTHPYVARFIKSYLGDSATAHPHSPYHEYLNILHNCDMMVNPFPFGNTNGIIDMVTLGLVGVCKTGPEVHEHIDEGLFKRLGLPEWLIANTVDEYVERSVRLAENHQERLALRRHIIENNGLKTLFTGDPRPMGRMLLTKAMEWAEQNNVALQINTLVAEEPKAKAKGSKATKTATASKAKATTKVKKETAKKDTPLKAAAKRAKKAAK